MILDQAATITLVILVLAFIGIWLLHVGMRDAGVIDFFWGPGFVVVGLLTAGLFGPISAFQTIYIAAVIAWAARLTIHLGRRNLAARAEDGRYRAMRDSGGPNYWWTSLFKIFLLQAVLLWVIALPVHLAMRPVGGGEVSTVLFWGGLAVFALGMAIEWIADVQLAGAKKQAPDGGHETGIVEAGLWGRSRHPNYLGEMILWWGLGVSACAMVGTAWPLAGPALLTAIMMGITLPLTEQHMQASRGEAFADYKKRVPMLLPRLTDTGLSGSRREPAE